ncbi:MAG: DNRLRE domain-containing protein [Myxococcales bacterium]|nr:DNRLRE domain-containing protein [Myxococcales bacterium]
MNLYATQSVSIQYPQAAGSVYRDNNTRAYNNPTGDCGGGSPCDITGWLHFDMTSIPDTATISAMTVNAYATTVSATPTVRVQYSSGNNWTRATVTQAALPRTTAQVGNPVAPTVNVYNAFPITISSRSWTADLVDNSLTFGLDNTNTAYTYAYFTGSDVGTNRPYLRITYCN